MTLKDREAVASMGNILTDEAGNYCEVLMDYHERQAESGAGPIVAGVTAVAQSQGGKLPRQVAICGDHFNPGLADAVATTK